MLTETKLPATEEELHLLCINTLRTLAMDGVEKAKSGHPGAPMGAAAMAFVLWTEFLKHNPAKPKWVDRDRFVLSAGHASILLYSLLHLTGYEVSMEDLQSFRQWGSRTPGHPEYGHTPGVEVTTGPLGQGFATGVGMAMAERFLAQRFNRPGHAIVDHNIFGIVSDGDLMEGLSHEAASLAGHLGLGKIVYLYDSNDISIDGATALSFTEDVGDRFEAYGWFVATVSDGNDLEQLREAIRAAISSPLPALVQVKTHIGFGAPTKQDSPASHGAPLGPDEVRGAKVNLGWRVDESFGIPGAVQDYFRQAVNRGGLAQAAWEDRFQAYREQYPDDAAEFERTQAGKLREAWDAELPTFTADDGKIATRKASGAAINAIAARSPELVGGSADLAESNLTDIKGQGWFDSAGAAGRNVHFGVREHAMGAALNGMALHGGVRPFGGTFLIFSDYMRPAVRLASLMGVPSIFVYTHDSIGLGEDGPTHQPIEHLAALRAIPGLVLLRPADANETVEAWRFAISYRGGPIAICLTRQALPVLEQPTGGRPPVERGAYAVVEPGVGPPDLVLLSTGSEVHVCVDAAAELATRGVSARVVSMPSWELFEAQDAGYREGLLETSPSGARVAVEAASPMGWHRYVRDSGDVIGLDRFGASAPGDVVLRELGFTVAKVVARSLQALGR
jgi:transketolase